MKKILLIVACLACSRAGPFYAASCDAVQISPIKAKQQFSDYYGTTLTANPAMLDTPSVTYRGHHQPEVARHGHFAAHVMSGNKKFEFSAPGFSIESGAESAIIHVPERRPQRRTLNSDTVKPAKTIAVDFR
jgi:hypothetical protein